GRSWLLIKHRDDWAGPIDITTFAPHSVKTADADLADILAADNPEIWHSHAPAKSGDTGMMFEKIIARALEIKRENTGDTAPSPPKRATGSKAPKAESDPPAPQVTKAKTTASAKTARSAKTAKSSTSTTAATAGKSKKRRSPSRQG
nr:hypothetical protein [Acidobacteriota bacterium]